MQDKPGHSAIATNSVWWDISVGKMQSWSPNRFVAVALKSSSPGQVQIPATKTSSDISATSLESQFLLRGTNSIKHRRPGAIASIKV
jgi:hypothetical protein